MRRLASWLLLILALLAAQPALAQPKPPLVLAAASLQESMTAAAEAWAAKGHPKPVISFAASSALARQIEAGAPADLFVSADEPWMDEIEKKGLIRPGTRVSFLANDLVLVARAGTKGNVTIRKGFPLARILGGGRLAIADPEAVPAGRYAKAALTNLGVWPQVANRIAGAESVRAALALVERGQAPYGIVYSTDARASKEVRLAGVFPASSHPPITYPIALLKSSTSPDAEGFRRFLISKEGTAIFRRFGFGTR